jgi:hypothetical protein
VIGWRDCHLPTHFRQDHLRDWQKPSESYMMPARDPLRSRIYTAADHAEPAPVV